MTAPIAAIASTARFHMAQSIDGPLINWTLRDWRRALKFMTKDDGSPFRSVEDLKQAFLNELAQGHKFIPLGKCDNFDFEKGCLGHPPTPNRAEDGE